MTASSILGVSRWDRFDGGSSAALGEGRFLYRRCGSSAIANKERKSEASWAQRAQRLRRDLGVVEVSVEMSA